jgi:adenine-specific DNA-methyltransferase
MLVFKNEIPKELEEIIDLKKIPLFDLPDDFDVLGLKGDNLHGLISAISCFKNSIKLIYADVPYNTGGTEFIYNDKFITNDSLNKHSSWISWMLPRLMLVRELLTEDGAMIISIDENERKNLENLCEIIFGEDNVLSLVTVVSNKGGGGRRNKKDLTTTNEYLVICAKNINLLEFGKGILNESKKSPTKPRSVVAYNKNLITDRTSQFFPFLVNKKTREVTTITKEEYLDLYKFILDVTAPYRGKNNFKRKKEYDNNLHEHITKYIAKIREKYQEEYEVIFPSNRGKWGRWVPTYETILQKKAPYDSLYEKNGVINYLEEVKDYHKMKTILDKPDYSNSRATKRLNELFGEKIFNTPKSEILMRDLITSFTDDGDLVMDWCAGSNSTYDGLVLANKLQNVNRKYVYVQNVDNGFDIFEEISRVRVDTVNKFEDLNILHQVTDIELISTEKFLTEQLSECNKQDFIIAVEQFTKQYLRLIKKFDKIYDNY